MFKYYLVLGTWTHENIMKYKKQFHAHLFHFKVNGGCVLH